jgi:hypothetical protein
MNTDLYVVKYVSPHNRPPSPEELFARRIARELKVPTANAISIAAPSMAALIDGPCWLVPVPASTGSVIANLKLAVAIVRLVPGVRIKCAVTRSHPVPSSTLLRRCGQPGLTVEEHAIVRAGGPIELMPVYYIDNVITTGNTVEACRRALGWGCGLAYAEANRCPHKLRLQYTTDYHPTSSARYS